MTGLAPVAREWIPGNLLNPLNMTTAERNKRAALVVLVGLWAAAGILEVKLDVHSGGYLAYILGHTFATSVLVLYWVLNDAEGRAYQPSKAVRTTICLLTIVGLPVYLLRSRGVRGILAVGLAAAFAALLFCAMFASAYLTAMLMTSLTHPST